LAHSNPDFAKLWGGITISDLSSFVTNLAVPTLGGGDTTRKNSIREELTTFSASLSWT